MAIRAEATGKSQAGQVPSTGKTVGFKLTKGWVVTLVGCGLAIYTVVGNKNPVNAVKLGPTEVMFGPLAEPAAAELEKVAQDVKNGAPAIKVEPPPIAGETERKKLDKLVEEQPQPTKAQPVDVLGVWHDRSGAEVQISTLGGNRLAYNETSNFYGIPIQSAAGQGTWTDGRFEFTFNTLNGLSGVAVLQPAGQNTLIGQATFSATGMNLPLSLSR